MILFVSLCIICFLFTIFLFLRYAKRKTHFLVAFCALLIWNLTFTIAILVPYDIYLAYFPTDEEKNTIQSVFYVFYGIIQLHSIIILPMMLEFQLAGEFTFRERLWTAFKRNLILYCVLGLLGVCVLGYLIYQKQLHM